MPDWQLSTLRALGLSSRGLAGGSPPVPVDPLTSPVVPPNPFATRRDRASASSAVSAAARSQPSPPPGAPEPHPGQSGPAAQPAPGTPFAADPHAGQGSLAAPVHGDAAAPLTDAPSAHRPLPTDTRPERDPAAYGDAAVPGTPRTPEVPPGEATLRADVHPDQNAAYGNAIAPGPYSPGTVVPPEAALGGGARPEQGGGAAYGDEVVPGVPYASGEAGAGEAHGGLAGVRAEEASWAQGANPSGTPIADDLMRRMRHGDPLARRVGRGVRRAVGARAAQAVREQEAAAGILGQVVSSCRRIAVTSLRGGAGKTTVTALVARTIAAHRGDRTLVLDADPSLGSLPLRLGVNAERTYRGLTTLPNWEAAQSYLTQSGERLWVASASSSRALTTELSLAEFQTAQGEFSRYFGISLVDCGPGLTSDLHQGILASSHAQILVAPATADGALSTRSALDWFLRSPHAHLLQRTLVVLVTHSPHLDGDLNRSRALLAAEGVPVIHLPYDRHLAAGTSVDTSLLAESSQATAVHLATAAFTRAIA